MDEQTQNLNDLFRDMKGTFEDCPARDALRAFYRLMMEFQARLDNKHELGVQIGDSQPGRLTRMEYWEPDLIVFYINTENGPVTVLQNHTQLNCLFVALPKANRQGPAVRLGFQVPEATGPERVSFECLPKKIS